MLEAETGPSQAAAPAGTGGVSFVAPTPPLGASPPTTIPATPPLATETAPTQKVSAPPVTPPPSSVPPSSQFGAAPPVLSPRGEKITPRSTVQSVGYFLFGASLAAVIASLGLMALKAQRTVAVSQAQASYETGVQAKLDDKVFKDQEAGVQAIGYQVNLLKKSLADRVMFSKFLAELEGNTYKKTRFASISANSDSTVTLAGEVADFYDLSKTITALKASKNFQKIELTSVTIDPEKKNVQFSIQIQLDKSLLKPTSQSQTASPDSSSTATADEASLTDESAVDSTGAAEAAAGP